MRQTPPSIHARLRAWACASAFACAFGWVAGAASAQTGSATRRVDLGPVPIGATPPGGTESAAPATVPLQGWWWPVDGAEKADRLRARPTVIALHGCGGLWKRDGSTFDERYVDYAAFLHARGWNLLLPDSLATRDSGPICSLPPGSRRITTTVRREDVRAALRWTAQQAEVQPSAVVVLGWSHGAQTALELLAVDPIRTGTGAPPEPAGAVVLYPGCGAWRSRLPEARQPVLMLLGGADDWTPPEPCIDLAQRWQAQQGSALVQFTVYAGAYHGFDGRNPVRLRTDVRHGRSPAGVHVGGDPAAREAAFEALDAFLAAVIAPLQPPAK